MLKRFLLVVVGLLLLAATAATAADPAVAGKVEQAAAAKAVTGADLAPAAPQNLFAPGGCEVIVTCPLGGSEMCIGGAGAVCLKDQSASPPWVSCNGVVKFCPTLN